MRRTFTFFIILFYLLLTENKLHSQQLQESELFLNAENFTDLSFLPAAPGWGYSFDNLTEYLYGISSSYLVTIDTIGFSAQNRPLLQVTINAKSLSRPRIHIMIHARTHPAEVQSSYVTNEIINILLSNSDFANQMIKNFVFHIIPMINPDGVELGKLRENANNVDLEGNWATSTPEPEVRSLKLLFEKYMNSGPLELALNMHSSITCERYFVYHHSNGTSEAYAEKEKRFINNVRNYWPDSIKNWNFMVTWASGTATIYPESWFWLNHGDKVLALTYEDMNCSANGNYYKTADAILKGIRDYFNIDGTALDPTEEKEKVSVFPNPVKAGTTFNISFSGIPEANSIVIISMDGRVVFSEKTVKSSNNLSIALPSVPKGIYLLGIKTPESTNFCKIIVE